MTDIFPTRAGRTLIPIAAIAALVACASPPPVRMATPANEGAPAAAVSPVAGEREVRYFFDEQGMLWDDRGRNLGHRAAPAAPGKS